MNKQTSNILKSRLKPYKNKKTLYVMDSTKEPAAIRRTSDILKKLLKKYGKGEKFYVKPVKPLNSFSETELSELVYLSLIHISEPTRPY